MGTKKFLTLDEALEHLHEIGLTDLDRKWISNRIDLGEIPAVVVRRKRRILKSVLDGYVEKLIRRAS